jgi:hypothetical protein
MVRRRTPKTVTNRKGLGSIEEAFDTALVRGACFISLDNVRGRLESEALESFFTEDRYEARTLRNSMEIDPRRHVVMFTSNAAEANEDIKNRTCIVRIRKRDEGYPFKKYAEGTILDHVRANQPRFLGAVFAVIREWHSAGKPRTDESRHDFRAWVQVLDWIVQNLLGAAPLLDGHQEAQQRMASPHLSWLRELCLAIQAQEMLDVELRTYRILDILDEAELEVPGLGDGDIDNEEDRSSALKVTGKRLGSLFRAKNPVRVDGFTVTRDESMDYEARKSTKSYRFNFDPAPNGRPICSHGNLQKPLTAPNAPESPDLIEQQSDTGSYISVNPESSGASGATEETLKYDQEQNRRVSECFPGFEDPHDLNYWPY